jgi:hypothetical protein
MWHQNRSRFSGVATMTLDQRRIQQRIEDLEKLARVFDAQAEHNESARDQTRRQIEVLKKAIEEKY